MRAHSPNFVFVVPVRHPAALPHRHVQSIRGVDRSICLIEPLESRRLLSTTYYVSPWGNNFASGTSTSSAWKTIDRVNKQTLHDGDKVLFRGGSTFSGSLSLAGAEGGTSSSPVSFGSHGSGWATISSGDKAGIDIADAAGVVISNLRFVGSGMTRNDAAGIYVHADSSNRVLSFLRVHDVEVKNYGFEGISIKTDASGSSLSDVCIERCDLHENLYGGIKVVGSRHNGNRNYIVDHVKAYNSPGSRSSSGVTGSGIFLADVDGAVVRRCVVHDNGRDGAAPVGIWAAGSNRVTFEYNEAYANHTRTTTDGGGFNLDWDVTNSVMQYNYSHGNDGPGYLLAAGSHVNRGNVIRYNVSQNDGRRNGRAAIHLWGGITDAAIYNNVIYMSATGNSASAALYAHNLGASGHLPNNVQVRNNIFYTTGGVKLIDLTKEVAGGATNLKFNGNAYYSGGSSFRIEWGDRMFSGLSTWRSATGQEKSNGVSTGYQGDPKLASAGHGVIIGNADWLSSLGAYKLQSTSPLINKGVSPPTFLSAAAHDFFGDSLPKGGKYEIGIDEVR